MDFLIPTNYIIFFISALILFFTKVLYTGDYLSIDLLDLFVWATISISAGLIAYSKMIPGLIELTTKAGITGKDLYKKGSPDFDKPIPESLGLAVAVVYISAMLILSGYFKLRGKEQWQVLLAEGLCYITLATFLGFADDMLELRWRDKLIYPFIFSIIVVLSYQGDQNIHLPKILQQVIKVESIFLGPLFFFYLVCLSIFCVNSINIYAGISGLETGQSIIIALTLILENLACIKEKNHPSANLKSLLVLGPFCTASFPLFLFNKVEKKTFVGDTFVYFAGCVISYAAIVGQYPIKVLFFLIPQIFNFVLSIPQLIGIIHCPRHRLPQPTPDGKLQAQFPQNLNNINFVLWLTGPMSEKNLSSLLLFGQAVLNLTVIAIFRIPTY